MSWDLEFWTIRRTESLIRAWPAAALGRRAPRLMRADRGLDARDRYGVSLFEGGIDALTVPPGHHAVLSTLERYLDTELRTQTYEGHATIVGPGFDAAAVARGIRFCCAWKYVEPAWEARRAALECAGRLVHGGALLFDPQLGTLEATSETIFFRAPRLETKRQAVNVLRELEAEGASAWIEPFTRDEARAALLGIEDLRTDDERRWTLPGAELWFRDGFFRLSVPVGLLGTGLHHAQATVSWPRLFERFAQLECFALQLPGEEATCALPERLRALRRTREAEEHGEIMARHAEERRRAEVLEAGGRYLEAASVYAEWVDQARCLEHAGDLDGALALLRRAHKDRTVHDAIRRLEESIATSVTGRAAAKPSFEIGDRVRHPKLGDGEVVDFEGGPRPRLVIALDRGGERTVAANLITRLGP